MNHKQKLTLARRMNGNRNSGAFLTPQWEARKRGIATRVRKQEKATKKRIEEKKKDSSF